jgi:hypothetical protein
MIPTEKNTIHFQQRLLPNCLKHDFEIVTVEERSQLNTTHRSLLLSLQGSGKKLSPVIL